MNQNPQPIILTQKAIVQTGNLSDFIAIDTGMGPYDQMNVFGLYCMIEDGAVDLTYDEIDGTTFTDIQNVFYPTRDAGYAALPLCCNPRPGMGEALELMLFRDKQQLLRGNYIPLALFNNNINESDDAELACPHCPGHTGKILLFSEPLAYYPTERFNIRVRNNNTAVEDTDTYTKVTISFICEIINKKAMKEMLIGNINPMEDME